MQTSSRKKVLFTLASLLSIIGYGVFVFAAPPSIGGYNPGEILDPECAPNAPDCIVALPGGGSGWSLTGNNGTTTGTNFIGTTDAQDFVVKTNGNAIAWFGQNGNVSFGGYADNFFGGGPDWNGNIKPVSSGNGSTAWGGSLGGYNFPVASGYLSTAWGVGTNASSSFATAWGDRTNAIEENATAFGTNTTASGTDSTAWGEGSTASGGTSTAFGQTSTASGAASTSSGINTFARSAGETAMGTFNVDYIPLGLNYEFKLEDRLLSIGNGQGFSGTIPDWSDAHNAYTLWKDGSFAYNDDNFQNDDPGTEQNMFYFNYGNHDGLGNVNTKRVIRLGSALNDEWDINSANVGDRSIAIGFGSAIASGDYSISLGVETEATGLGAIAWGEKSEASGIGSTAWGDSRATAMLATAFGNQSEASGEISTAIGSSSRAHSYAEFAIGSRNTEYIPNSISSWDNSDRLFIVGNGDITNSDAFTILKNGKVGIGIDNFEDILNQLTPNTALLQVSGDIAASGDVYAAGVALTSDARLKTNVQDLNQGLDTVLNLRPVSYDMIRDGSHQLGFIAQEIQNELPMLVHDNGYLSLNYIGLTPVIVKAIQEMNLNITELTNMERPNTWRDSLIAWFGNVENGITDFFAKRVTTDELCVGTVCVTQDQFLQMVQQSGQIPVVQTPSPDPQPADTPTEDTSSDQPVIDTVSPSDTPAPTENTDIETSDTPSSDSSFDAPSDSGIDTETAL